MKENKSEIFYLLFIIFSEIYWFNGIALGKMDYAKYLTYPFIVIALIFYIIYFIMGKYSIKTIITLVIGVAISLYYYIGTGLQFEGILTIVPAIIGLNGINVKKVVKVMCYTLIVSFLFFIIANMIGVVPYSIETKVGRDGTEYDMLALGNQHGNPLYLFVFCIISSYLYISKDKYNYRHFIFSLLIAIVAYLAFQSRTGFLLSIILIIGMPFVLKIKRINKILKFFIKMFPTFMVIFVVLFSTVLYNTAIAQTLDKIITSRLSCANYYFTDFGTSLLPRYVPEYLVFDNMYAFMVVEYGIIFTVTYCFIYYKTIGKLLKNKRYVEIYMIILYALYSYCEKGFLKIFCNFPMLFIAYLLYDIFEENNEVKKNEKK